MAKQSRKTHELVIDRAFGRVLGNVQINLMDLTPIMEAARKACVPTDTVGGTEAAVVAAISAKAKELGYTPNC